MITVQEAYLLVDGRYYAMAKKRSPFPVQLLSQEALKSCLHSIPSLAFDHHFTTVERLDQLKRIYTGYLQGISLPLKEIRVIKEPEELKALEKSAALLWKGFEQVRRRLKSGITEKEIALEFEVFCRQHGAEKMAFDPIIAFGKNSAYPHYRAGNTRLKKGDVVLIDIGISLDNYHSDMTRTLFFGKADPRLVVLDTVVKEAHAAALAACRVGAKVGDLDCAARHVIEKAGLADLLAHSLGHGIGLETHEFPRIKCQGEDHHILLKEGMVITIEPGLYLPGVGGIRHEDTVRVTGKGYKNFYV